MNRPLVQDRRRFLGYFSSLGLGATLFPGALWAKTQENGGRIDLATIESAEKLAGLEFLPEEREMMRRGVESNVGSYERLRELPLSHRVPPAMVFDPVGPGMISPTRSGPRTRRWSRPVVERPDDFEEVAFWPVSELAELLRTGQTSSVELTEMYLSRLKWFDEKLHCVVTLCEEQALAEAEAADVELSEGRVRGPLHGIPWGAKDLLHTRGIPTTYGAKPFAEQVVEEDATVVRKLREAGAVLVAKLSLGALAMGDVWFKERTRNPWNPEQGSSGSSAGPAAATAGGLVGFSIGTETLGSIVSPSTRCGVTGLRPTYGRVSRAGAMALSWTMDKIGPMCRSVEDCAMVFEAIEGADPLDRSTRDADFNWDPAQPLDGIRVGLLEVPEGGGRRRRGGGGAGEDSRENPDEQTVAKLRELGIELVPVQWPDFPVGSLRIILNAEAAAAFDDITRDGRVRELVGQGPGSWPNSFRTARTIPAVEYIRANQARTLLMEQVDAVFDEVDVIACPAFAGSTLTLTNLTGHPCLVLPNGFRGNSPTSYTFIGKLYGEAELLRVAKAYQDATEFHVRHPDMG